VKALQRMTRKRLTFGFVAVAAVLLIAVAYYWLDHETEIVSGRTPLRVRPYQPIVAQIAAGTLKPAGDGTLKLPSAFAGLVLNDTVHVDHMPDGRLLVLFPTQQMRGIDFDGYLYASGPLTPADYKGPVNGSTWIYACGATYLQTEPMSDPHWYSVSRRME
jgi:hypothetical protein